MRPLRFITSQCGARRHSHRCTLVEREHEAMMV